MAFLRDCTGDYESKLLEASNVGVLTTAPVLINTAGAVTYTAAQVIGGLIVRDPNGASRTDVFPTAALLIAGLRGALGGTCKVGQTVSCTVINDADAAETITHTLGSGMTSALAGGTGVSAAIGQNASKRYIFRVTVVTAGSEAVVVYA